ncbi:nucleotidyltransferase family protein [Irregularibacter muris]|uniref:Nucleotidyltransferase family protein n=1 Tax=Irregularibacter muris TaxID=1796619 RepID=A0AAE3L307_9FIRM|nr:nucleotidyltransferase family protein [Irregularibacter muris]MCR1899669.1 nucleotidyltransferase family protein [Irregularibacter muris]
MQGFNENKVKKSDLAAIIVAAGYSSRMKKFKPLLPLGHTTIIETAIDGFLQAGIDHIIVVIGFKAHELKPILEQKGIKWVYNDQYHEGMYSSILAGIKSLSKQSKGFFLLPADIPLFKSKTIDLLYQVYSQNDDHIVYPVHQGKKGHPPLIPSTLFSEILQYNGDGGLKTLLNQHKNKSLYMEVQDEGILYDADTPKDYLTIFNKHCPLTSLSDK